MNNTNNKNARGFVTVAPSHLQKPDQTRYLFSGFDQTSGEEVFITFRPIQVPGHVTPDEFAEHVTRAVSLHGALSGTLTLLWPEFDLGRFTYYPPGSTKPTESGADDPRQITKEMAKERPELTKTKAPERTPTKPAIREPEPGGMDMF